MGISRSKLQAKLGPQPATLQGQIAQAQRIARQTLRSHTERHPADSACHLLYLPLLWPRLTASEQQEEE